MTREELQLLLSLLEKFEKEYYPEDDGTSELSDLHSVQYDVKYSLEDKND